MYHFKQCHHNLKHAVTLHWFPTEQKKRGMGDAFWGILMLDFRCILQMSRSELPLGKKMRVLINNND